MYSETQISNFNHLIKPQNNNSRPRYSAQQYNNYNQKQIQANLKQFQSRLDSKIQKVALSMMSKTHIQQTTLPYIQQTTIINNQTQNIHKSIDNASTLRNNITRNHQTRHSKAKSQYNQRLSTVLKNTSDYFQVVQNSQKMNSKNNRVIGNKKYAKPKIIKNQPQILPKQVRNNPFSDPMPVTVQQINKGLLNLLNKGIIAKDVDISTAFQRGQPPMKSKGAVLHNFQQKMVKDLPTQAILIKQQKPKIQQTNLKFNKQSYARKEQSWAITGVYNINQESSKISKVQKKEQRYGRIKSEGIQLKDIQIFHIQFKNFEIVKDSLIDFKKKHYDKLGEINNVIKQIEFFLKKYGIRIAFVDGKKMLKISNLLKRIKEKQILDCLIGNDIEKKKLVSVKYIQNGKIRNKLCTVLIQKGVKMYLVRKQFIKSQNKKISKAKIMNWLTNKILYKRLKKIIQKNQQNQKIIFQKNQLKFIQQFSQIKQKKHFQIHIPNHRYDQKIQLFHQKLNVQITRIFNIKDPLINIVYVCPFPLTSDITNYYYKILELGEIPNYKQRITFIQSDPKRVFNFRFTNSKKFFYSSKGIRKLKQTIKDTPAYIISSFSLDQDIKLASYLRLPIFYNYQIGNKIDLRSQVRYRFKQLSLTTVPSMSIQTNNQGSILDILIKINKLYSETKCRKYLLKINNMNDGIGLATVVYPISNVEQLYAKTTIIYPRYYIDNKAYYSQLLSKGGIIQKIQNNISSICACLYFKPNGQYEFLGSFDKISNGYVNVCYSFPQQSISHEILLQSLKKIIKYLIDKKYYGFLNISFIIDNLKNLCFNKVKCYLTKQTASIFYFRYLMNGKFLNDGTYSANVTDTIVYQDDNKRSLQRIEQRTFLYAPFILHFGLSQIQIKNFFQLCRIQGISFDLEKKFGSTFILIDSLKSSIGLLTTGKHLKISMKLMILTLGFLLKQNFRFSNDQNQQKQLKLNEKCNISAVKSRLEQLNIQIKSIQDDSIK